MALAPFRWERAVKEILLVKALPLRVVLLYRTAGWNARLFRKSLCKRLCKSLKARSAAGGRPSADTAAQPLEAKKRLFPFPSAEGRPSADPAAQPVEASQALPGRGIFAMTWLCIAADRWRGYAVPTARGKRGQGHRMVPLPPLDSPKPSFALTHRRCAAKRGLRGLGSVRRAGFGRLLCPEFTLRGLQRCQCAARRCRALDLRCEKLRFDQGCALGAANAPVGPSHLDARPKGVAS